MYSMQSQTHETTKILYNEKRAILEQCYRLDTYNRKSNYFITFSESSNRQSNYDFALEEATGNLSKLNFTFRQNSTFLII